VPRYFCFWRIFKRTLKYYGKETPSSARGCKERIDWQFLIFLKWVWDFRKNYRPKILALLKKYHHKKQIYVLHSAQEIEEFIRESSKKMRSVKN
jgi:adenylate kinase family enzyme